MKRSFSKVVKEEPAEDASGQLVDVHVPVDEGTWDAAACKWEAADDEGTWDEPDDGGSWEAADAGSWWDGQWQEPSEGVHTCTWADDTWKPCKQEWQQKVKYQHGYGGSSGSSSSGGGGRYVKGGWLDHNNMFHPKLGLS